MRAIANSQPCSSAALSPRNCIRRSSTFANVSDIRSTATSGSNTRRARKAQDPVGVRVVERRVRPRVLLRADEQARGRGSGARSGTRRARAYSTTATARPHHGSGVDEPLIAGLGSRPMKSFTCRVVLLVSLLLAGGAPALAVPPGWAVGASVGTPRDWHSATLLRDGSVLIAGGYANGTGATNKAERYFPATEHLGRRREPGVRAQTARRRRCSPMVECSSSVAATAAATTLRTAEIYDPAHERVARRRRDGDAAQRRDRDPPARRQGARGRRLPGSPVRPTRRRSSIRAGTRSRAVPGCSPRAAGIIAVQLPGGNVLLIGGQINDTSPGGQVELYDWARKQWTTRTGMGDRPGLAPGEPARRRARARVGRVQRRDLPRLGGSLQPGR